MPLDSVKIRKIRENARLTVTDAADAAGIQRTAWHKYEAGGYANAKLETAERIAAALRCSLLDIVSPYSA